MIPKIIHFCWLSNEPYPILISNCIKTWKKVLPDYKIIHWNCENFDINSIPWVKEAFASHKYAFAADYIRFYALYNYGGIYLDSDVEVLKTFNDLLINKAFIGYENVSGLLEPAIVGSEKGSLWCKKMMEYYESKHFDCNNIKIAPLIINDLFKETFTDFPPIAVQEPILIANNTILLCPPTYFSPIKTDKAKNYGETNKDEIADLRLNPETYCIHRFNGSWVSPWRKKIYDSLSKIIGVKNINRIKGLIHSK